MKGWLTTELYIARWGFLLYSLLWIAACVVFVVDCEIKDRAIASLTAERDSLLAIKTPIENDYRITLPEDSLKEPRF